MAKDKIIKRNMSKPILEDYQEILTEIQSLLERAKYQAYKMVDNIRVQTYWQIGERITRAELAHKERADYGEKLVVNLAEDLGFQKRIVYRMIQFYGCYQIVSMLSTQLSWSHYVFHAISQLAQYTTH